MKSGLLYTFTIKKFALLFFSPVIFFVLFNTLNEEYPNLIKEDKPIDLEPFTLREPEIKELIKVYQADIEYGLIGNSSKVHIDNAFDNVFHINLPVMPAEDEVVLLRYRLKGLAHHISVPRSINGSQSSGGYIVKFSDRWTIQEEYLSRQGIHVGINTIHFTLPKNANFYYEVADVSLAITKRKQSSSIILNSSTTTDFGTHVYLKGILNSPGRLFCNNEPIKIEKGEFEIYHKKTASLKTPFHLELKVVLPSGKVEIENLVLSDVQKADQSFPYETKGIFVTDIFKRGSGLNLQLTYNNRTASVSMNSGTISIDKQISLIALRSSDLPPPNLDMVNVTAGAEAYRLLPYDYDFKTPVNIRLPYDKTKLPEGYTSADIRAYYFNHVKRVWLPVPMDSVNEFTETTVSKITQFGDIINGIIKVPESPQTQGYTPTSIKDYKLADPSSGIEMIAPPIANSRGTATLSYPFKLPKGRLGLQPDLTLQYSNENNNGWAGLGWNIFTPMISIDTRWGVPRYDQSQETETYIHNGEQLAPISNRTVYIPRISEKQFYHRVEGGFEKIIRHGDRPSNYWWEVTNKNGTKSFYGGTPSLGVITNSVLMDANGNIAHWGLVEIRDLHNNFIRYHYDHIYDTGVIGGTVMGLQMYLSKITYTGYDSTEGPYNIEFIRNSQLNESRRKDVEINGRFGFKMVTGELIRKISISYNNQLIRTYDLQYKEGEFSKSLLMSVSEIDNKGAVFNTHKFDYYNDVRSEGGLNIFDQEESWSLTNDNIKGDFINSINGFTDESSALNTEKSSSSSSGLALTIGFGRGIFDQTKAFTLGGSAGSESGKSEGLIQMIDINGDGLPDKIFKRNGHLFYRPNLGSKIKTFGDIRPITGLSNFSYTTSKTSRKGLQIIPYLGFLGYENSTITNNTTSYFADFNGDGLVDVNLDGRVFFNHLDVNGNPTFEDTSSNTPNPILAGSIIDDSFFKPDHELQKEQEEQFPLQDAVRFWQAPFDGRITINAPLQLLPGKFSGVIDPKQDGVKASIQLQDYILWTETVSSGDYTLKFPNNLNNLEIHKGDKIFFRLHSIYNGNGDQVKWDPEVTYLNELQPEVDANGRSSKYYKASDDFVLDSKTGLKISKAGVIRIDGKFIKAITTDSVTLKIERQDSISTSIIYTKNYAPETIVNEEIIVNDINVNENEVLLFLVESDSYIDRSVVKWSPHYQFNSAADGLPVVDSKGKPIFEGWIVTDNSNFNHWKIKGQIYTNTISDTVEIIPRLTLSLPSNGNITFTIKGEKSLLFKKRLQVSSGMLSDSTKNIKLALSARQNYFLDFTCSDTTLAKAIQDVEVVIKNQNVVKTVKANLYLNPLGNHLGYQFRGWGQFSYKGDKWDVPIDTTKLNMLQWSDFPNDPGQYVDKDTTDFKNLPDPTQADFIPMYADARHNAWIGLDSSVYVGSETVSSSRLWLHDVAEDSPINGSGLMAVPKVRVSKISSYSLGLSTPFLNSSINKSSSSTTTRLDMIDMNGDNYPDVLNQNNIQYSQASGLLEGSARSSHGLGSNISTGKIEGATLGGHFLSATSANRMSSKALSEIATATATIGIGGNIGTNEQFSQSIWLDINGDGLPDKVFNNGFVALNLGYRFSDVENWGIAAIDKNQSKTIGGGLTSPGVNLFNSQIGKNLVSGSFEGGFGLTRSTGASSYTLSDINGDGLVDQIYDDGIQLGIGSGFGTKVLWKGLSTFSNSVSTGESANTAFTIAINISIPFIGGLKICINPSFSSGHGISREKDQIIDIDGDGFPDIAHSDNDGDLRVQRSLIGRTNLLRSVKRPLGSTFALDYLRIDNNYNLSQSKWVLKNLAVFDGVKGDGVDTTRSNFSYVNGYYNRREREFFGFTTVITDQLNTADKNVVYRSTIQEFITSDYYSKGLVRREWLQDAQGLKFNQTDYIFNLRKVQDNVYFPAQTQVVKTFYEGQTTGSVITNIHYDYDSFGNVIKIDDMGDGRGQDQTKAVIFYHDDNSAYIKGIPKSIEVNTIEGLKRKRSTTINKYGSVTQISQYHADGKVSVHDLEYDKFGNLAKITRPANYRNERLWYAYKYDSIVNTYISKVNDAYGYSSTSTYEFLFGNVISTVSMNNQPMRFDIDERGRVRYIKGPYEIADGKPYTIAFEYFPDATTPYAITHHFDPEHNKDINTITFVDGLGRGIQVKKNIALFAGKGRQDVQRMVVSGRVLFDAVGRAIKSYYPLIESISSANNSFNNSFGRINSTAEFDIKDRMLTQVLADGATTTIKHNISNGLFTETVIDPLRKVTEFKTDVKGRKREQKYLSGPNGTISTKFDYNALNELIKVIDNNNNLTSYSYDNLGRKLSSTYPGAGTTSFVYDAAGNMIKRISAQIKKEIPNNGAINFLYEYERIIGIDYPRQYQNRVNYKYGSPDMGNRAGRLILQQDASGGIEFYYGKLGEITKEVRTVMVSDVFYATYVSEQSYDTWNRIKTMTYPDGEVISYHYNQGGGLNKIEGKKQGNIYSYVDQLGYDEYGQRVYLKYGNGTETNYSYDNQRRRLSTLKSYTVSGQVMMDNVYAYDAVSNILSITNNAKAVDGKLGGYSRQDYKYDNLYRLTDAAGVSLGAKDSIAYTLSMGYDNLYNVTNKKLVSNIREKNYSLNYEYSSSPYQASKIGITNYIYDLNGNSLGSINQKNFWDEENRLMGVISRNTLSEYTYDAGGERVVKSSGGIQGTWVNGAPAGTINHQDNYTVYVSPYLVCRRTGFTKHVYIESQRVVTKVGNGSFSNISFPQGALTAGGINYLERAADLKQQRIDYYISLGNLTPGPPTNKLFYAEPQNSGLAAPVLLDSMSNSVPAGWPGNNIPPPIGPPIYNEPIPSNDSVKAGYGFRGTGHFYESIEYFYHSDHLGSTSYITDPLGEVSQHLEYIPFGETFVDERQGILQTPYLFNAKELDEETGYYYYGARYYDPKTAQWLSVDPLADKTPDWTPYRFGFNNPIRYTDPDGRWEWDAVGNLKTQKGDNSYSLAKFLGTKQRNAMTILNRAGVTANDKGVLNLKEGQPFANSSLWVGTKSGSGAVVNNTIEAWTHYANGKGTSADVGGQSTRELLSSSKFQEKHTKITTQTVDPTGYFSVDMTNETFHIGRTNVDYNVSGNDKSSSVTYILFVRDGFWDPDFIDESTLGKIPIIRDWTNTKPDGPGPNLERFRGTPYHYKTRERTYFFKPVEDSK